MTENSVRLRDYNKAAALNLEVLKMKIEYRKLAVNELDTFIEMRIAQLREEGAKEDIDLVPYLKEYYKKHMGDGTFVSWIALDDDKIVGTSGMSFVERPPIFRACSHKKSIKNHSQHDNRKKN